MGVHEATIRWIGSFLTDRSQRVRIGQVYSQPVTPNGGIPQGTKLAPLLFAILVNNLCRDWRYRIKYVDDTSVFESIPRCSPSYLPFIAANINTYASMRNMRLNEKKCKDMVISFLKYQPTVIMPIQLNGIVIDRISSYMARLLEWYFSTIVRLLILLITICWPERSKPWTCHGGFAFGCWISCQTGNNVSSCHQTAGQSRA